MLSVAIILACAGVGMIVDPTRAFPLNGMREARTPRDRRTYQTGGTILLLLAAFTVIQLFSE